MTDQGKMSECINKVKAGASYIEGRLYELTLAKLKVTNC